MFPFTGERTAFRVEKKSQQHEKGFATAEWIILIGFTIVLLATLVQGLYVENVRQTSFAFLNDAARAGSRSGSATQAVALPGGPDNTAIVNACESRLTNSISQSTGFKTSSVKCSIGTDAGSDRVYVEATVGSDFGKVKLLPGAEVFKSRLNNLSQRYYPAEAAK